MAELNDNPEYRKHLRKFLREECGLKPRLLAIYEQAFMHRSLVHELGLEAHRSNERLEFLGDVVLGLAITEALLRRYPDADEGTLSKMKAQLGSRQTLGEVARRMGLNRFLRVGRGEEIARSQNLPSLMGNTLEALVGAAYLDLGFVPAAKFVVDILEPEFGKDLVAQDYKSVLQEFAQRRFHSAPHYEVLKTHGPEHRKVFDVLVRLNGKAYGKGKGHTKKDAEQDAARHTLERFRYTADTAVAPATKPLGEPRRRWWPFRRRAERLI
jgi:ribonuclease-3